MRTLEEYCNMENIDLSFLTYSYFINLIEIMKNIKGGWKETIELDELFLYMIRYSGCDERCDLRFYLDVKEDEVREENRMVKICTFILYNNGHWYIRCESAFNIWRVFWYNAKMEYCTKFFHWACQIKRKLKTYMEDKTL